MKAVRKAGLGVGLYYSPLDWRFPGFFFPGIYQQNAIELRERTSDKSMSSPPTSESWTFSSGRGPTLSSMLPSRPAAPLNNCKSSARGFTLASGW